MKTNTRHIITLSLLALLLSACQSAPVRNPADNVGQINASSDPNATYVSAVTTSNRKRGIDTVWVNMPRAELNRMRAMEQLLEEDDRLDDGN
ncbi:MAG: hypothetical protein KKC01_08755 [Gammaproteobacteria bacterium]|nr:hypothetical protein [Gammaproteobacteria bacterium]